MKKKDLSSYFDNIYEEIEILKFLCNIILNLKKFFKEMVFDRK
jgi:hypothetical protein